MASSARVPDPAPTPASDPSVKATLGLTPEAPVPVARLPRAVARHLAEVSLTMWVCGTLSDVRRTGGGAARFLLRDGNTTLECVALGADGNRVWRQLGRGATAAADAAAPLRDGEEVAVHGALRLDARRVALQFAAVALQRLRPAPVVPEREQIRQRLERDGLLDPRRKRRLPRVPRRVALIASPSTAGHLDVLAVARARHPGIPLDLVPAQMQGEGAPRSIVRALERARTLPGCDVIILARGGGAAADLAAFDDETLARAIAASPIPVVTGIGHETDTTLADCVADRRSATPTAAAMEVVPVRAELAAEVERLRDGLARAMAARLERERRRLARAGPALAQGVRLGVVTGRRTLERLQAEMRDAPARRLARERAVLERLAVRVRDRIREALTHRRSHRDRLAAQLAALDPAAILARGYAIAFGPGGEVLDTTERFVAGDQVVLRLRDGTVEVRVDGQRNA